MSIKEMIISIFLKEKKKKNEGERTREVGLFTLSDNIYIFAYTVAVVLLHLVFSFFFH